MIRLALTLLVVGAPATVAAQAGEALTARLAVVPVDAATVQSVSGRGEARAVIVDTTVYLIGTFDGLSSAATAAALHRAPKGQRGRAELPVAVEHDRAGALGAAIDLDVDQVRALEAGEYYLQIQTEGNSEGEIRGWLLTQIDDPGD